MINADLDAFRAQLEQEKLAAGTIASYLGIVRAFLRSVGNRPVTQLGGSEVRQHFKRWKKTSSRKTAAHVITRYIRFAAAELPVVVGQGALPPPVPRRLTRKELALREKWTAEKLTHEKDAAEELSARLARKVIDHYLFFQRLLKTGGQADLDEVARFADEAREIIESNLPLFMGLSAGGLNVHPRIDERMQR
jgi:hypothetical protein